MNDLIIKDLQEHRKLIRCKYVLYLQRGYDLPVDQFVEGEYPVMGSNGCIGFHSEYKEKGPGITIGRSGSIGEINYVEEDFWPHNTALFVLEYHKVRPKFAYYLLKSMDIKQLGEGSAVGTLNRNNIHEVKVPQVPLDEQVLIEEYLDKKTTIIDTLIAKKQKQIELLEEKRVALITQAVSKGLNPQTKMKDSGIEWLGMIPEHWNVSTLKRLGDFQGGAGFPDDEQGLSEEEIPFYKVSDTNIVGNEIFMSTYNNSISREIAKKLRAFIFPPETIVFAKVGAALLLNKRRILTRDACIDNNMMGFILKKCDLKWMYYWLCQLDLGKLSNPGAVPSVNEGQLKDIPLGVPPIKEQWEIGKYIEKETNKIDHLMAKIKHSIDLLTEYRASLITSVVTRMVNIN